MKIKQTITTALLSLSVVAAAAVTTLPVYANQQQPIDSVDNTPTNNPEPSSGTKSTCGGAETSIISCPQGAGTDTKNNGVWYLLTLVLKILTAGVGIVAVGGIAYGAALYASSADKPDQAKAGMTYIKNVVIGLIAYGLMFILLNFLIPGGIFN